MEEKKRLHQLFENLEIGIGGVSKSLGVSQRQLRYWEEKGYIHTIDPNSGVRRYSLATVFKIGFIKDQLDEGYTLEAAVKRSNEVQIKSKIARKFLRDVFDQIEITDADKGYGKIKLGAMDDENKHHVEVTGIVDEKGSQFELREK